MRSFAIAILLTVTTLSLTGCTFAGEEPDKPTPNLEATVEVRMEATRETERMVDATVGAQVAMARNLQATAEAKIATPTPDIAATVTAGVEATLAAQPTNTPIPTPTPQPTATLVPTSTPEPQWQHMGNWVQAKTVEQSINEFAKSTGLDIQARIATLHSDGGEWGDELSISIGCIGPERVAYLTPYSGIVPNSVDTYVFGLWNNRTENWVEDDLGWYGNPDLTDDGSSIYIPSPARVNQIVRAMERANQNRDPEAILSAGIFNSENDEEPGLWGEFDASGLESALKYLTCFGQ